MCRIDDADYCEEVSTHSPMARKDHQCGECGRTIAKGERYERFVGKDDGLVVFKTCAHCCRARDWLNVECGGFIWGEVADELAEHWYESPTYRTKVLRTLVMGMRRGWRRKGELLPIPA